MKRSTLWLSMLACSAMFAACSSTPTTQPATMPAPAAPAPAPAPAPAASPTPTQTPSASTTNLPAYLDPSNPISQRRSVYFDFDRSNIKPQYNDLIAMHGKYLVEHSALNVRLEGNADERGSAEYNLALGQRRADSVEHALELYGVKAAQLDAISYGSERPKATGHDEAAWAENRRVDIVYPGK